MRAWRHCMAATHDRELCDAGARWELKLLAEILIAFALFWCVLVLIDRIRQERLERR